MNSIRRVLAISPHLDDAALSVGATLADFSAQGTDVEVLTLFAGAPHEPLTEVARAFHAKCGLPTDAAAVALRRDEDRAAMHELGAHAHHREFLDVIYRRAPDSQWLCRHDQAMFDALPLDRDLLDEVSHEVRHVFAALDPDLVLTCAAIGAHIDHRLTSAAVLHAATNTTASILLWEDLPYATGRPPAATTPYLTRPPPPEAWERKWRAITCYTTQVRMLWPTDTDWAARLLAHAHTRGHRRPAELLFEPPLTTAGLLALADEDPIASGQRRSPPPIPGVSGMWRCASSGGPTGAAHPRPGANRTARAATDPLAGSPVRRPSSSDTPGWPVGLHSPEK